MLTNPRRARRGNKMCRCQEDHIFVGPWHEIISEQRFDKGIADDINWVIRGALLRNNGAVLFYQSVHSPNIAL